MSKTDFQNKLFWGPARLSVQTHVERRGQLEPNPADACVVQGSRFNGIAKLPGQEIWQQLGSPTTVIPVGAFLSPSQLGSSNSKWNLSMNISINISKEHNGLGVQPSSLTQVTCENQKGRGKISSKITLWQNSCENWGDSEQWLIMTNQVTRNYSHTPSASFFLISVMFIHSDKRNVYPHCIPVML